MQSSPPDIETNEVQQLLFESIKARLPAHLSLVDEVAEVLDISNDNSYRKINGEADISLKELAKLAAYFKISVDEVLNLQQDGGIFTGKYITADNFNLENYLQRELSDLRFISSFQEKEAFYLSKDIPGFHFFAFPELAAFKYFFWMKTLFQFPQLAHSKFSVDLFKGSLIDTGLKIVETYNSIPGTEIMSIENITTTLLQIDYCKETYLFRSEEDLKILFERLHEMTDHLERMAESGKKFLPGQQPDEHSAKYDLYINDFLIADNSILVITNGNRTSFLVHGYINYIMITNPAFTSYTYNFVQNVIKESILISEVGEKYRSRFFHIMHERIEQCRNNKMQVVGKL